LRLQSRNEDEIGFAAAEISLAIFSFFPLVYRLSRD